MYLYMLQNGYNEIMGEICKNAEWITENKRTNSVTQKMYASALLLRIRAKFAMGRHAVC